jgi:peptidoglycan lytic transglycosylase
MTQYSNRSIYAVTAIAIVSALGASVASKTAIADATDASPESHAAAVPTPSAKLQLDRSGQKRTGKASFYADHYSGKTMADGTPMRLYSNNAASITLPLGTTAKVTNLETGRSAIVTIRDRGPYVAGRIVDLSPATARKIGLQRKKGLAKVEVAPLTVPLADGTVKVMPGAVAMASS